MVRHKFTLEKNGDYSIFRINFKNGKIMKKEIPFFSPKNEEEAALICCLLNKSSQLD